jgi:hypothetical protein
LVAAQRDNVFFVFGGCLIVSRMTATSFGAPWLLATRRVTRS